MSPPLGFFLGLLLCVYSLYRTLKVIYALEYKELHRG